MTIVRIALDIEVEPKIAEAVKDALFEDREAILNYIRATSIPQIDSKVGTTVGLGGNSHVHSTDDGACEQCARYARKAVLTPVK